MVAVVTTEPVRPQRINVAVNEAMLAAIELVIAREWVSLTEAVRRLIGYGEAVYRAVAIDGREVVLEGGGKQAQRLVLLDPPARQLPADGGAR